MRFISNVSVRTKILTVFLVLAAIIGGLCACLALEAERLYHQADDLASNWMPRVYVLGDMSAAVSKLRQMELAFIRGGKPTDRDDMASIISDLERERKVYEAMISSEQERSEYDAFGKNWQDYLGAHEQLLKLAADHQNDAAQDLAWNSVNTLYQSELSHLGSLIDTNVQGGADAQTRAISANHSSRIAMTGIAVTLTLAGIGLWFMMARIVGRLRKSVAALQRMAQRDLTTHLEVQSNDEFGQIAVAVNSAVEAMSNALREMNSTTLSLSDASEALCGTSTALARGASQSSASLDETSRTLEEITQTVRLNAENAGNAHAMASEACTSATQAEIVVQSAVNAMTEIHESSSKVADIIGAIDDIAFQTNLLAINAAIEAGIAGQEGRGFAVVAQEVRVLAKRTASSAKEIRNLIANSVATVERGFDSVQQCGKTLREILGSVQRVSRVVQEISNACTQQAGGVEQVNVAVAQIDRVTQSGTQETEHLSVTARQLSEQASGLKQMLSGFTFNRAA